MAPSDAPKKAAMAVGAHPDDIEFMMAGTLLLLEQAGYDIHMWSLANGCCGTAVHDREDIVRIRLEESRNSARVAGSALHEPIVNDLEILFEPSLVARVAAVLRAVKPDIILVPAPDDYMEDHINTSRVLVTGAFARGMLNFRTEPEVEPWQGKTVIYHAMPHGLTDGLGKLIWPGWYVDIGPVIDTKRRMLECHASQEVWLCASQAAPPADSMVEMCARAGEMSGRFRYAEGWRRHSHLGFCAPGDDPLSLVLEDACMVDGRHLRSSEFD